MTDIARVVGDPEKDAERILRSELASFDAVLFQRDQMHSSDEFTLAGQIAGDRTRRLAATLGTPGWSTIEQITVAAFNLTLPVCRALIGDEPVRVGAGSAGIGDNVIAFGAAPGSGTRWDLLYLESWVAEVGTIGSADSTSKAILTGGGIGNPNLAAGSDYAIKNPEIDEETARRTQVRWRFGVATGVDLSTYPDGLGDPSILGRGDAGAPVAGLPFQDVPARSSLWRAGDGGTTSAASLGSATGYSWAIPVIALLRTAGESALTLTGSRDLRKVIVSRTGQVKGWTIQVLAPGEYTVGVGSGVTAVWKQPKMGAGYYPANVDGADDTTPLTGIFPVFPSDFDLPPGWSLSGRLVGTMIRKQASTDTGSHSYGLRVRKPSQTYGQSVAEATWSLGPVDATEGDFTLVQDHLATFDMPTDGSADGMWVVELYTDQAGPSNWATGGVWLRVYAEND